MIELYYWPTPNGHKITMCLEEAGLDYAIHPVNISAGDQFKPDFLVFSPNNRMPAIIDRDPADGGEAVTVFESGAILLYLAEKTGRFLPADLRGRKTVTEWLFWQMGGLGPMAGQNHHFAIWAPEKLPYAISRYINETIAFREGAMVSVDLLYRNSGRVFRRVLDGVALAAGLGLMVTIVWFGFEYAWRTRFQTIAGLESFSVLWAYLAMPVGGLFSILALFAHWFDPRRHEIEVAL